MRQLSSFGTVLFACAALLASVPATLAAEFEGVPVPDTQQVNGDTLYLNGVGRRNFTLVFVQIHIYIASLYLTHPSTNPEAIIQSPETKLLSVVFERDVSADDARKSWRTGFANNCLAPCHLPPEELEAFIAEVPEMRQGDRFNLLFQHNHAVVSVNGRPIGEVTDPQFANAMLATFLGPNPASPPLRQALLAGHS